MAFIGIYCVKHMCLYWPIFDSKFYLLILTAKNELVQSLMVMRWSQSAFNLDQAIGSIAQLWMDSSKKFADLGGASKHLQKWCLLNQPILHRVWTSKMQRYKTDNLLSKVLNSRCTGVGVEDSLTHSLQKVSRSSIIRHVWNAKHCCLSIKLHCKFDVNELLDLLGEL